MTTVVDDTAAHNGSPSENFVYFYCDRNQADRRDPKQILSSFVQQLSATTSDKLPSCVTGLYHDKQGRGFASGGLSIEESVSLFSQLTTSLSALTIIIDALDECDPESRLQLLEMLSDETRRRSRVVKIFVSSRPDQDIRNHLSLDLNLEIDAVQNSNDIATHIKDQIRNHYPSKWQGRVNEGLREIISEALINQSQGMYVIPTCLPSSL